MFLFHSMTLTCMLCLLSVRTLTHPHTHTLSHPHTLTHTHHTHTLSPTHPLTHSLTHSLTNTLTQTLTQTHNHMHNAKEMWVASRDNGTVVLLRAEDNGKLTQFNSYGCPRALKDAQIVASSPSPCGTRNISVRQPSTLRLLQDSPSSPLLASFFLLLDWTA